MLELLNEEFFSFDVDIVNEYISINVMVDPQKFTLKTYKRSPFASIVVKSAEKAKDMNIYGYTRDGILTLLNEIKRVKMQKFNTYTDDEYDKISKLYDNRLFHTIMFYFDIDENIETEDESVIMIGAFPVKGMISKIQRSHHFLMYNGALIQCKPYKFNDNDEQTSSYYNKIVYCLVDIKSYFDFQEFGSSVVDTVGIMRNHLFYLCIENDNIDETSQMNISIHQKTEESLFPMKGREFLFDKPCKNIFFLSDVPRDIMTSNDMLSVKLG